MVDLKEDILRSAKKLEKAWVLVQSPPKTILPIECYEHWTKKASLHRVLSSTGDILPARKKAWEILQSVPSILENTEEGSNNVKYGDHKMDFSIFRHLLLTPYVTTTWAIYDRLANVCGRLAAISNLSENPKQNPKIFEDFLNKKDTLGFSAHKHLKQAYSWPLKVSYKIRNWLVHEGYEEGTISMFKGNKITDGFTLHDDAIRYLESCCNHKDFNNEACNLKNIEECWQKKNLLTILDIYHAEIDTMFSGLIKWSVDSFVSQIISFSERDKEALTSASV